MSIINDALKKVQQSLNTKPIQQSTAPQPVKAEEPPVKSTSPFDQPSPKPTDDGPVEVLTQDHAQLKKNIAASLISIIVVIACGALTWFQIKDMPQVKEWQALFNAKLKRASALRLNIKKAQDAKPLAQVAVEQSAPTASPSTAEIPNTAAVEAIKPLPPLMLNIHGVMANGSANIALINNQVYQEGDTVEGVKILKINLNEIVVLNNGREQTIAVRK